MVQDRQERQLSKEFNLPQFTEHPGMAVVFSTFKSGRSAHWPEALPGLRPSVPGRLPRGIDGRRTCSTRQPAVRFVSIESISRSFYTLLDSFFSIPFRVFIEQAFFQGPYHRVF
jgi:hypothetical protein